MNINQDWVNILTTLWWAWAVIGSMATTGYIVWIDDTRAKELVRDNRTGWIGLGVAAVALFLMVPTNAVFGLLVGGGVTLWVIIVGIGDDGADMLVAQNRILPFLGIAIGILAYIVMVLPYISIQERNTHLTVAAVIVGGFILLNYQKFAPEETLNSLLRRKPAAPPKAPVAPAKFKTASILGGAKVGDPYSAKVEVEGGSGKGKFEQVGSSPSWTIVAEDGSVTGIPGIRSANPSVLTVRFTDEDPDVAPITQKFTIPVTK